MLDQCTRRGGGAELRAGQRGHRAGRRRVATRDDVERARRCSARRVPATARFSVNNAGVRTHGTRARTVDWDVVGSGDRDQRCFGSVLTCRARCCRISRRTGTARSSSCPAAAPTNPLPRLSAYAASRRPSSGSPNRLRSKCKIDGIDVNADRAGRAQHADDATSCWQLVLRPWAMRSSIA